MSPLITEHPEDTAVEKNSPVTLKCSAEGDPEPKIRWFKDGDLVVTAAIDPKSHRVQLPSGSLFFLRAVQSKRKDGENDAGVYWCNARNALGEVNSRNATLIVAGKKAFYPS